MPQTMTTNLPERSGRLRRLAILCLLLAALAGCGPGTGGTGTGPVQGVLNFSSSSGSPSAAATAAVTLRLEAERVELRAGCSRFVHEGPWSVSDEGKAVLDGTLDSVARTPVTPAPATLELEFSEREPTSATVTVLLRTAGPSALPGAVTLQRAPAGIVAPPDCDFPPLAIR